MAKIIGILFYCVEDYDDVTLRIEKLNI